MTTPITNQLEGGLRFNFGRNWESLLSAVDERRIQDAETATKAVLGLETLEGKSFLDIGSGSGLFSLVAMRLGAEPVHSFDYDSVSVDCTREMKRRFFPGYPQWSIEQGSILDAGYLKPLGQFDIVYSWGVLHHTGNLWQALENAGLLVKEGGLLFVSIYNYQPIWSRFWYGVKSIYNRLPWGGRWAMRVGFFCYFTTATFVADVVRGRNPLHRYTDPRRRGMSTYVDVVDWIGGFPFETAKPESVFNFCRDRGFMLKGLTTCGGRHGCNEFVFWKRSQQFTNHDQPAGGVTIAETSSVNLEK